MGASKSANHKRMSRQRRIRGPASRSRSLTPLLSIKQPSNPTTSSRKTTSPTSKKSSAHRYRKSRLSDAAREKRTQLAGIAVATQRIVIGDGNLSGAISVSPVSTIDIGAQIELSKQATEVFPHYSEPLSKWRLESAIFPPSPIHDTTFNFTSSSVMDTVARLAPDNSPHASTSRFGAISAACPTRPAGSWLSGAVDTETQLARGTSLAANLQSDQASSFYTSHRRNTDHSGLRTHAMIYTPNVLVLRPSADSDVLLPQPKKIDVLSVAAVHAKTVHSRFDDIPSEEAHIVKDGLHSTTLERLGRALRVLADRGVRHLVLPAFGCEAGQGGDVADVAAIYAELLVCGDARGPARFKGVFESVTFCTEQRIGKMFRRAWENRVFEDELERALSEEEETMN